MKTIFPQQFIVCREFADHVLALLQPQRTNGLPTHCVDTDVLLRFCEDNHLVVAQTDFEMIVDCVPSDSCGKT